MQQRRLQGLFDEGAIEVIEPPKGNGLIAGLLNLVNNIVGEVLKLISTIVGKILAPLLDPVIDQLLALLGIDLAQAEVEGRMDCGMVDLVY